MTIRAITKPVTNVSYTSATMNWEVEVPAPVWDSFTPLVYSNSDREFKTQTLTAPGSCTLYATFTGHSSANRFQWYRNGSQVVIWNGSSLTNRSLTVNKGDSVYLRGASEGRNASNGTVNIRRPDATGEILADFSFSVRGSGSICYLTTAMVEYYGYYDDGPELTAMRALRKYYYDKHVVLLEEYAVDSGIIIEEIERSSNPEYYYNMIKEVVLEIVTLVVNQVWEEAEEKYLNLYYDLKKLFINN